MCRSRKGMHITYIYLEDRKNCVPTFQKIMQSCMIFLFKVGDGFLDILVQVVFDKKEHFELVE